jgi:L-rhamnose mutarotase
MGMERYAFMLRLKAETIDEYEQTHRAVWPELLAEIKAAGISHYSIFRRGQDLFLFMHIEDFDKAWVQLAKAPANQRWQKEMARFFEPVPGQAPGERFAMMKEVFYLD